MFKLASEVWRTADPCVFESRGPRNLVTTVVIKAIQAQNQPWNYSGAQPCPEHIKLRIPAINRGIFSRQRLPLCTVQKPPNPGKLFQGPYYNPHVWQLSHRKMGLSFALYENETLPDPKDEEGEEGNDGGSEVNEITQQNGFILSNAKLPKFVHIVFASFIGKQVLVSKYSINGKLIRLFYSRRHLFPKSAAVHSGSHPETVQCLCGANLCPLWNLRLLRGRACHATSRILAG